MDKDKKILKLFQDLWNFPRSITGNGVRISLDILAKHIPINQFEYPTGQECFDWNIPEEWNINTAYIKDTNGNVLLNFDDNNLHLVSYSEPINKRISKKELFEHLYTLPEQPDAIPYRTSYYEKRWGFCIQHNKLENFKDEWYDVFIDSTFINGSLTIGECTLEGESEKTFLLSSYLCHPSMANNELSGPIALVLTAKYIMSLPFRRYTYKIVIAPETIGSIVYLSQNFEKMKNKIIGGLVVSQVGINAPLIYKKTRNEESLINRTVENIFHTNNFNADILNFDPNGGGDQRQYSSLGINLPIGYLGRSLGGNYPQYHTSLDDLSIISLEHMVETIEAICKMVDTIEANDYFVNTFPYCEPNLGKRGLYPTVGGTKTTKKINAYKYLLGYADGDKDLLAISKLSNIDVNFLSECATELEQNGLLKKNEYVYNC